MLFTLGVVTSGLSGDIITAKPYLDIKPNLNPGIAKPYLDIKPNLNPGKAKPYLEI